MHGCLQMSPVSTLRFCSVDTTLQKFGGLINDFERMHGCLQMSPVSTLRFSSVDTTFKWFTETYL